MILGSLIFGGAFFKATRKAVDHDIDAWFVPWVLVSAEILQRWYHVLGITGHPGNGDIEMEILPLLWISYCILLWISYVFFFCIVKSLHSPRWRLSSPFSSRPILCLDPHQAFVGWIPLFPTWLSTTRHAHPLFIPFKKFIVSFTEDIWRPYLQYIYISTIYRHVYFTDHISSTSIYIYIISNNCTTIIYILYPLHIQCYHKI